MAIGAPCTILWIPTFTDFEPEVGQDAPLVFLSRVERIKGAHTAITVARRTGRRLIIAGNHASSGPELDYWTNEIAPHLGGAIEYVGPVDDQQKNALLGQAAALIVPIEWNEPFGIVFAEALACGTPVISCPRGALPEIVRHGVDGFLVTTIEEACNAVAKIDKIDRRNCRKRVEDRFSATIVSAQYERLYEERLAGLPMTHTRRIAIVTGHFPPSNLAGVHRSRLWAQHLPEFGWEPIVVTAHSDYYEEQLDPALLELVSPELRVIRTRAIPVEPVRLVGDIGIRAFYWQFKVLDELVRCNEIDFIHITIPSNYTALLGEALYRRHRFSLWHRLSGSLGAYLARRREVFQQSLDVLQISPMARTLGSKKCGPDHWRRTALLRGGVGEKSTLAGPVRNSSHADR